MKTNQNKIKPETDIWGDAGELTGKVVLFVLSIPFFVLRGCYKLMVEFQHRRSILLGVFRVMVYFYIMSNYENIQGSKEQMMKYMSSSVFDGLYFLILIFASISFFVSLAIAGGLNYGTSIQIDNETSGFPNIDSALRFREGVVAQQSTTDKVKEYAKTSFVDIGTFKSLGKSNNMREALGYLDGQLAQQSTTDKYNMLKKMFGGK